MGYEGYLKRLETSHIREQEREKGKILDKGFTTIENTAKAGIAEAGAAFKELCNTIRHVCEFYHLMVSGLC